MKTGEFLNVIEQSLATTWMCQTIPEIFRSLYEEQDLLSCTYLTSFLFAGVDVWRWLWRHWSGTVRADRSRVTYSGSCGATRFPVAGRVPDEGRGRRVLSAEREAKAQIWGGSAGIQVKEPRSLPFCHADTGEVLCRQALLLLRWEVTVWEARRLRNVTWQCHRLR